MFINKITRTEKKTEKKKKKKSKYKEFDVRTYEN